MSPSPRSSNASPDDITRFRTERAWLDGIRAGNVAAFESFFRAHFKRLCNVAFNFVGSREIAEELVQNVLFRIWQHRDRLDVTGPLGSYLTGAVRNEALAQLRRARVERRWSESAATAPASDAVGAGGSPGSDERVLLGELEAAIQQGIDRLPPRCRQAFVLRRQHHLSYAEIARIMQISPKTVEVQIGATLKLLRVHLSSWLGDA